MLVKSNSVPNFLFETPKTLQYKLKLSNNVPKILPYSEFLHLWTFKTPTNLLKYF